MISDGVARVGVDRIRVLWEQRLEGEYGMAKERNDGTASKFCWQVLYLRHRVLNLTVFGTYSFFRITSCLSCEIEVTSLNKSEDVAGDTGCTQKTAFPLMSTITSLILKVPRYTTKLPFAPSIHLVFLRVGQ